MSLHERLGVGLILAGGAVLLVQRALSALKEQQARRPRTPCGNPIPKTKHAVLPASATAYRRIIIVGDVHGCPDELQALLDKVRYRKGVDVLLSVGDLVNKGPDSERVLRMAVDLGMLTVRGNHDDSAYAAFRCWLDGKDIPKPNKHGWVAGLDEQLAALLSQLPFTLQLPAYGVVVVHAGLVPGTPLEQQEMEDMVRMRDVVPATEAAAADAAAATVVTGGDLDALPASSFSWEAAVAAVAELAAADRVSGSSGGGGSSAGAGGLSGQVGGGAAATAAAPAGAGGAAVEAFGAGEGAGASGAAAAAGGAAVAAGGPHPRLPAELRLLGREVPNPLGRAWADIWRGPQHVIFGHDAKRRLQRCPAATGLDTGCVYGGQLTAAVLPPLDEQGQPLMQRLNLPPDAEEFRLCNGLPAFLVQVPAKEVHSDKFLKAAEQEKVQRQEAAKQHTRALSLELGLQQRQQALAEASSGSGGAAAQGGAALAASSSVAGADLETKSIAEKKQE